jgi:GNAT superfamily N-acetyltransferase
MKIFIREAQTKDSKSIAYLSKQLGYPTDHLSIQNRIHHIIQDPNHRVFVAILNEQLVGWIHGFYILKIESDPFVEIGGLVVDKDFQKSGIGKKLVLEITQWSTSFNCDKVRVRCNTIRKEAHAFYEKIGFMINKEQKVFDQKTH